MLTQKEFDQVYARVPRLCVDLLIKNEDGVLLTYRTIPPSDIWHLPGGTVKFDESVEEAVLRVAKKELGIDVKINKLFGILDYFNEPLLLNQHAVSIVHEVEIIKGEIKLNEEASKYGFFKKPPEDTVSLHRALIESLFS